MSASEVGDAVYMLGMEGYGVFENPSLKSDVGFRQVPFTSEPT